MARRAHGAERVVGPASKNLVGRHGGAADSAQHRLEGARRHGGIGVDMHDPLGGDRIADFFDKIDGMTQRDGLDARRRRQLARERLETLVLQGLVDGRPASSG
jgi:hypothetical protein